MENWNVNDVFAKLPIHTSSRPGCHIWALKLCTAYFIMRTADEVASSGSTVTESLNWCPIRFTYRNSYRRSLFQYPTGHSTLQNPI